MIVRKTKEESEIKMTKEGERI